jgi:nucleoside-diphosphate-sugar epimerase
MKKILVIGSKGQIGSELVQRLRKTYGISNVISSDVREKEESDVFYEKIDVLDRVHLAKIVKQYNIDAIYNLAALLSAKAEELTNLAWDIGINGMYNVLEVAREHKCAVFFPSSIGAFGPSTPKDKTPQDTIQRPQTMYGVTKVTGELLSDYYHKRFGVDTRGVRFPGLISYKTLPGGGTTDYAVEIFYAALKNKTYECPLKPDTQMDMMYMRDALDACLEVMEADPVNLIHRNSFNVTAMSFTPEILAKEIQKHIPEFTITYNIDPIKQAIADSWPNSLDDTAARSEWGWNPSFDLASMVTRMLEMVAKKF